LSHGKRVIPAFFDHATRFPDPAESLFFIRSDAAGISARTLSAGNIRE
jgi:hypothetical protein